VIDLAVEKAALLWDTKSGIDRQKKRGEKILLQVVNAIAPGFGSGLVAGFEEISEAAEDGVLN
jgi:hypothetical protein